MGFSKGRAAPEVSPELELLRYQPHLLLASLQRTLLLRVGKATGTHFEGLAAAGKAVRPTVGNTMASKLRLIDEAHNLVRHISPESCAVYIADVSLALGEKSSATFLEESTADVGSVVANLDKLNSTVGSTTGSVHSGCDSGGAPSSIRMDAEDSVDADLFEIFGEYEFLEADTFKREVTGNEPKPAGGGNVAVKATPVDLRIRDSAGGAGGACARAGAGAGAARS